MNATGLGAWSENGDIRPEKPASPLLLSPIVDVTTASLEYRWTRQELATEYRMRIYDRTEKAWVYDQTYSESSVCGETECALTPDLILSENRNHMWRVAGKNVTGQGAWGGNEQIHYEAPEITSLIDNGGFESGLTAWERRLGVRLVL